MDYFLLFGLIGFGCLILGFIGYSVTTNKIIKSQEREIEILKTDNKRLRSFNQTLINQKNDLINSLVRQQELKIIRQLTPDGLDKLKSLWKTAECADEITFKEF